MGKNSWLTAVKRAFRSPTKDSEKKSCRRKVDSQPGVDDDEKKLERRKWLFKRHSNSTDNPHPAKAAVQIVTPPARATPTPVKLHLSATVIQTAFRGYLARRALVALKGIVKLQAIIRGQNVRNQASLTMRCMQTLLRVQARMRDQRARLSHDVGLGRRSMFAETTHLWDSDSDYTKTNDVRHRKSRSRDGSSMTDDWRDCPRTLEELEAVLKARKEAAPLPHQNSLAFAFSQQNKIMGSHGYATDGEENIKLDNRGNWLEQWMAGRQQHWQNSRPSADYRQADSAFKTKTTSIDSLRTSSAGAWKSRFQSPAPQSSPRRRSQSPETPRHSTRTTKSPQIRPASPGRLREEKYPSAANTPSLRSGSSTRHVSSATSVPNYMAATESAKARIRWQSAPRQRPPTPETERVRHGSARKRLSYQTPEPHSVNLGYGCHNLRSPSFKSVQEGCVGMEAHSCYTESVGGEEISPSCSTTDLRRWLR